MDVITVVDVCSECWDEAFQWALVNFCGLFKQVCRFADTALWPPSHFGDTESSPSWKLFEIFFQNVQMFASLSWDHGGPMRGT